MAGDFNDGGREWMTRGQPDEVQVHDHIDKTLGNATPYGASDVANDQSWVSVRIDYVTGPLCRWRKKMWRMRSPHARNCRAQLVRAEPKAVGAAPPLESGFAGFGRLPELDSSLKARTGIALLTGRTV